MKFSLISATSMLAVAASAQAYVVTPTPSETNLYGLVHDSDGTAAPADLATIAVLALQATDIGQQQAGFTGPVDQSAATGAGFPLVPLGAAPSTPPDEDFATQYTGAWHWNTWQRALAIGIDRIAPLIGTIGNGSSPDQKPGSTVFVAETSSGFNAGGISASQRRTANAFAPSSTSTATVTLTGPASIPQRAGSGFSVAAPVSAEPQPAASQPTLVAPAQTWRYAPQPGPGAKSNLVAASFGNVAAVSGLATQPANPDLGAAPGRANLLPNSETAAGYARRLDMTQPIDGQSSLTGGDGTRTYLPASVSANPAATAARYVTSVLDAALGNRPGRSVEAFEIGPPKGAATPGRTPASVTVPLQGKIMAGVGPLDNSLALP